MKSIYNSMQRVVNWLQNGGSSSPSDTTAVSMLTQLEQAADALEAGLGSKHLAADAIGSTQIANDAVTNDKLANMTRGTVKVGGASNAPTDLSAKTAGQVVMGDGTDVKSLAISGDATLAGTGALTIANNAVTGLKLSAAALKYSGFSGVAAAGPCTLTGAKVGDKVVGVVNLTDGGDASADFEATITVVDQIQQGSASDLSLKKYSVLLVVKG